MNTKKTDTLFNEALDIIKRNAQKDPDNAYSWIDLLEDDLEKYSDFDSWCLQKYGMPANNYLLDNGIIHRRNEMPDCKNLMNPKDAIDVYNNAIEALQGWIGSNIGSGSYSAFIVGDAKLTSTVNQGPHYSEESLLNAHKFFMELDKYGTHQTEEKLAGNRDDVLQDVLDTDFYSAMEGVIYPEVSIAVAIAYVLFIDSKAAVYLEFVRDKWEYRGDYGKPRRGDEWLYFYYSSDAPAGEVGWRFEGHEPNYHWEYEKKERERKEECEQMISPGLYDEVESLDFNDKRILFATGPNLFGSKEYKYVAGSMSYLFNYACSFVGSVEAKPNYIVIAEDIVTREALQSAIIYKKLKPDTIMLEVDRFVDLLEKVDLEKIRKSKSSITKADFNDDYVGRDSYGFIMDESHGESLKEIFVKGSFTDLEKIKAAKHISATNDINIKDKVFVFTGIDREGEDIVRAAGGIIKKSISGKTDYFVFGIGASESLCAQANALYDKGKGDNLHIITPRILNQLLENVDDNDERAFEDTLPNKKELEEEKKKPDVKKKSLPIVPEDIREGLMEELRDGESNHENIDGILSKYKQYFIKGYPEDKKISYTSAYVWSFYDALVQLTDSGYLCYKPEKKEYGSYKDEIEMRIRMPLDELDLKTVVLRKTKGQYLEKIREGDIVRLYREPDNKKNPDAIFVTDLDGHFIGYVNDGTALYVAPILDNRPLCWRGIYIGEVGYIFKGITIELMPEGSENSDLGIFKVENGKRTRANSSRKK